MPLVNAMKFTVHNKNTAPDALKPVFDQVQKAYGFIPNLNTNHLANTPIDAAFGGNN